MITQGTVLRLCRLTNDLSIKQTADKVGVSSAHISEIERDRKHASILMLKKLSKVYGIPGSEIFRIEEVAQKEKYSFQRAFLEVVESWLKYNSV